ncbi:MAG: FKBP-type peptidyl-prolyl cis-trans isomerase [Sporichthyaceae bacterium]
MSLSSSRFVRSAVGAGTALVLTLSLSACGGDDTPEPAAAAEPAAEAAPQPLALPTPSVAPLGSGALPGVPAITKNATVSQVPGAPPTIAKGTGDAPTQLVIRDLVVGNGETAVSTDTVDVRYVGAFFDDGKVFDSSWERGNEPVTFPLNGVVKGFAGGIVGMKLGGRREIVIPGDLAYGANPPPGIPPNAVLVFVVDLMGIDRIDPDATAQ